MPKYETVKATEGKKKGWAVKNGNRICNDWVHDTKESADKYKRDLEIFFGGWKNEHLQAK